MDWMESQSSIYISLVPGLQNLSSFLFSQVYTRELDMSRRNLMRRDRSTDKDDFMFHIYSHLSRQFRGGDSLKTKSRAIYTRCHSTPHSVRYHMSQSKPCHRALSPAIQSPAATQHQQLERPGEIQGHLSVNNLQIKFRFLWFCKISILYQDYTYYRTPQIFPPP